MSALRLTGATSGWAQLEPSAIAGDQTFTLPGTGGTLDRLNRAGNILQVVQGSTSTSVTVTTTTYTDTGLSASITPTSSSSKILVIVDQAFSAGRSATSAGHGLKVLRGSTVILIPQESATGPADFYLSITGATAVYYYDRATINVLDSPNTTSSITYKTQGRPHNINASGNVEYNPSGTVANSTSYITLIEVAA